MNRWYHGHDKGSPDSDDRDERCACGEVLWTAKERHDHECRDCHKANDESERWIDRHERKTA